MEFKINNCIFCNIEEDRIVHEYKNFYVIKTDKKNENFENYFFKGKRVKNLFRTYNSSNTKRLDEKELIKILSKLFF